MKYVLVSKENPRFELYCHLCKENVVMENLIESNGTLLIPNAVFYSNVLIIALTDNGTVVGCIALNTKPGMEVYINQIAVKNECKRNGIGRELVAQTQEYANGRDIICHIREFNTVSQSLFESCGFIKDEERSSEDNYFYRKNTNNYARRKNL